MANPLSTADTVTRYLNSFATGKPDAIVALVTDDFENIQVSELATGCTGIDIYRERLAVFLATFKNLRYAIDELIVDGDKAAVAYTMRFVMDDRNIEIEGVMVFKVRNDLIASRKDYWDGLTYQKQTVIESS